MMLDTLALSTVDRVVTYSEIILHTIK